MKNITKTGQDILSGIQGKARKGNKFTVGTVNGSDCFGRDGWWHPVGNSQCNKK